KAMKPITIDSTLFGYRTGYPLNRIFIQGRLPGAAKYIFLPAREKSFQLRQPLVSQQIAGKLRIEIRPVGPKGNILLPGIALNSIAGKVQQRTEYASVPHRHA